MKSVRKKDMNHKRELYASNLFCNQIFTMGGADPFGNLTPCCEVYDIVGDHWTTIAKLNQKRSYASSWQVDEKYIYLFGGITSNIKAIQNGTSTDKQLNNA